MSHSSELHFILYNIIHLDKPVTYSYHLEKFKKKITLLHSSLFCLFTYVLSSV